MKNIYLIKLVIVIATLLLMSTNCSINNNIKSDLVLNLEKQEINLQKKILIKEMQKASETLHKISWPILEKNYHLCSNVKAVSFGSMFVSSKDLPNEDREIYNSIYNADISKEYLNDELSLPVIISVAPNSPSEIAGLKKGDVIYRINKRSTKNFREQLAKISNNKKLLEFDIIRKNKVIIKKVKGINICNYNVQPLPSGTPNAFADGQKIFVTLAAIKLAKTEDEIAFLIGHELAHNIYHFKNQRSNEAFNFAINYMDKPKIRSFSSIFVFSNESKELFADIEGVKLAHNAGYKLENVNDYWRRLSIFYPKLIENSSYIYKGNAYRAAIISRTLENIRKINNEKKTK